MQQRHENELLELDEQIEKLKLSERHLSKKEMATKVKQLRDDLFDKHNMEIDNLLYGSLPVEEMIQDKPENNSKHVTFDRPTSPHLDAGTKQHHAQHNQPRISKGKLKKLKKQEAFEQQRIIAKLEASKLPNMREIETIDIDNQLSPLSLIIHQVKADGHCLYYAIAHQLSIIGIEKSFSELREITAEYMINHVDEFIPFLYSNSGDTYSLDEYTKYCSDIKDTAVWGGQLELAALSKALAVQIQVFQMKSTILKIGVEFEPILRVSYHKYSFGLGEHYNSVVPK